MTATGAKNKTREQMLSALSLTESTIVKVPEHLKKFKNSKILSVANALHIAHDYPPVQEFQNNLVSKYNSEILRQPFYFQDTEQSTDFINAYIEQKTNNLIKDLLAPGSLSSDTQLVITNAIYFKGEWKDKFNRRETEDENFDTFGTSSRVQMMHKYNPTVSYGRDSNASWVWLPYKGGEYRALVVLPNETSKSAFQQTQEFVLSSKKPLAQVFGAYENEIEMLAIPKFKIEWGASLTKPLKDLGMTDAFSTSDFSGISTASRLFISDVIHKAYIKVDEEGTEAAAATAVIMDDECCCEELSSFICDHPFVFVIEHVATGSVVFYSAVCKPSY
jgi:serpin B